MNASIELEQASSNMTLSNRDGYTVALVDHLGGPKAFVMGHIALVERAKTPGATTRRVTLALNRHRALFPHAALRSNRQTLSVE